MNSSSEDSTGPKLCTGLDVQSCIAIERACPYQLQQIRCEEQRNRTTHCFGLPALTAGVSECVRRKKPRLEALTQDLNFNYRMNSERRRKTAKQNVLKRYKGLRTKELGVHTPVSELRSLQRAMRSPNSRYWRQTAKLKPCAAACHRPPLQTESGSSRRARSCAEA